MSLNAELRAFNEQGLAQMPPEVVATIQKDLKELQASGLAKRALTEGAFPDFSLPNALGQRLSLQDILKHGPAVISFYRGSWCPYCNIELRAHQQLLPELQALGAQLIAISPEQPDHSLSLKEKQSLEFEVLSDSDNQLAKQLGLVFELSLDLDQLYQQVLQANVAERNGSTSPQLPMPATYVLNRAGDIVLAHVQEDYAQRLEPAEILAALKA
ncbi:MAG: AhpC/TSA family protein [Candidatus Sericytochromatia bacterium]|nr:AhpC/TSA family protein [Candidatus Sericytochromatia bacterium]